VFPVPPPDKNSACLEVDMIENIEQISSPDALALVRNLPGQSYFTRFIVHGFHPDVSDKPAKNCQHGNRGTLHSFENHRSNTVAWVFPESGVLKDNAIMRY